MTIDLDEIHPSRFVQITGTTVERGGTQDAVVFALDARGGVWRYDTGRGAWWPLPMARVKK